MICLLAAAAILHQNQPRSDEERLKALVLRNAEFLNPRFQLEAPCPTVPPVMIDQFDTGVGLAPQTAKAFNWQARILWIDATANIDQYNSSAKIDALTEHIADAGFNTVVFDIKPISGQTVYPSRLAPKLTEWRNQMLPIDFDPMPDMITDCHTRGLSLLVSMNAFSEGHRLFKVGPGYDVPEHQTVIYQPGPVLQVNGATWPLSPKLNQPTEGTIDIQTSLRSRQPGSDTYAAVVDPTGRVTSSFQVRADMNVVVPASSTILVGSGSAGEFVRTHLSRGTRVSYDTVPNYVRIGDMEGGQVPLMMNVNDPNVREHALAMIKEVVSKYAVDGVIYDDRLRYAGIDADFSEVTRSQFESFLGRKLTWPDDVFKYTTDRELHQGILPGRYYDAWMAWRAARIRDYVRDVRRTVQENREGTQFGVYVGSWYGDYPALGHNYASPKTRIGLWFDTPTYQSTGTSPLFDFLIAGCYYRVPTIYDAMSSGQEIGSTIEGAGTLCSRLVRDQTWTYAGIDCEPFLRDPKGLADAVQAACASTEGVMVFDLSHGVDQLWPTFRRIFGAPRKAPHQVPGAVSALRKKKATYDRLHVIDPPIVIAAGTSGTGQ